MILKEKEFTSPSDSKLLAGEEAEKQLAHYLKRAFKKRDDCFVINDLRITDDGETAQIDHLIVSPYALVIIESKSCHSTIIVDEFNRWARTFNGKAEGMKSPVLQAEEQGKIVRGLLRANAERLLGKILMGSVQKGFAYCPVLVYVSVSDSGIIEQKIDVPELFKADEVATAITLKLDELKNKSDRLSPKFWLTTEMGWRMQLEETKAVAGFLMACHQPILPEKSVASAIGEGMPCPKCNTGKQVRKKGKNGKPDFFGCSNYGKMKCNFINPIA